MLRSILPSGYFHLLVFGIVIPWLAIRGMKLIESRALPPRRRYFVSALAQTTMFALFSLIVAWQNHVAVLSTRLPPLRAFLAGLLFLAVAVPFGWTRWRKAVIERKRVVALFMPTNNTERALWVATALAAGIGEELTWRGVQTTLLMRLTESIPIAVAICIVMFSIAHAMQGWKSVGIIAVFAAGFHVLVWVAGSLYVAMIVHFVYDLIAGLAYSHLGRKYGYRVEEVSGAVPVPATDAV